MASRFTLRMMTPLFAISVLLLMVGGGGAWYVHRLSRDVSGVLAQNIKSLLASERLALSLRDTHVALHRYLIGRNRADLQSALACRLESEEALSEAELLPASQATKNLIAKARAAHDRFFTELSELGRNPSNADYQRANALVSDLTDQVLSAAFQLLDHNRRIAMTDSARSRELADRVGLGLLLLGSCGAVAGLLVGFAIARGVSRSLVQLSLPVRDTAGKLAEVVGPIALGSDAGLAELESVMRTIAEETSGVVARLQQSQREAMRREQLAAVGQLAAGLAHELRNPLTSMKILVQAAMAESAALTGQDLNVIEQEITRLENLTQTFLDFARPQQLQMRSCDVGAIIDQTTRVVSGRAGQQGVAIECQIPKTPLVIDADTAQIRQVVLNLLLNALDALPRGGNVTIKVTRQAMDHPRPQNWLNVTFSDDGPGLPQELGDRIFEPFVSTRGTGIGLGLSICRRIVEAHGGTITAANRPTRGAEFTLMLPITTDTGAAAKVAGPTESVPFQIESHPDVSVAPQVNSQPSLLAPPSH